MFIAKCSVYVLTIDVFINMMRIEALRSLPAKKLTVMKLDNFDL